jgi:hypothetical protein
MSWLHFQLRIGFGDFIDNVLDNLVGDVVDVCAASEAQNHTHTSA